MLKRPIIQGVLLFIAYVMTAKMGFHLESVPGHVAQLWAPAGIALAALLFYGIQWWPFLFLASVAVSHASGIPWLVSVCVAAANTFEVVIAVYGLRKFDFDPTLARLRDVLGFFLIAGLGSPLLGASIGVTALAAGGMIPSDVAWKMWRMWWLGDVTSTIVITPFLLTWGMGALKPLQSRRLFEALGFLVSIVCLNLLVFSPMTHLILPTGRKGYLIFPLLVWAALRFGSRGVTLGMLLTSILSLTGAALGWGPFIGSTLTESLVNLQVFLAVESATALVLAAVAHERLQAGSALRESEERFRRAADAAPIMIWMAGTDKLCNYFNREWVAFTGRKISQEIGNGWAEGVHKDDLEVCLKTYLMAFNTHQPFQMEYRLKRFDGEYRWVADRGTPRFVEKKFEGYLGTCIDIHDRKLGEQALEQKVAHRTSQLAALNKELEAFSYSVSHDLRAPLRAIDGFSRELMENANIELDHRARGDLKRVRSATQRMAQLIDDLLNFSRLSRSEIKREKIDLSALACQVIEGLRGTEPERVVTFTAPSELPVHGDAHLLRVVLENLLGNAWKFTGKAAIAEIVLGMTLENEKRVYFIRDNGAGFNMQYADKLFGVFQRLHTEKEFSGTGIGLATVQRIIHRHGGEIRAESQENHGTTFFFTLP
jgi:PAS domain S-box-containing protein